VAPGLGVLLLVHEVDGGSLDTSSPEVERLLLKWLGIVEVVMLLDRCRHERRAGGAAVPSQR
jgi:hypothetical protein